MNTLRTIFAAMSRLLVSAAPSSAQTRPNIIVIVTDDQRWDCLGVAGHPFLKTPNIDRLAREGAYFRNSFVTLPLCSPSRASLLTGRYARAHKIIDNSHAGGATSHRLDNWARRLQQAGYDTACIGKWHMGTDDAPAPGFERWVVFKGQGRYFDCIFNMDGTQTPSRGYVTDVITDHAVEFIAKPRGDRPFALYIGHKAVHSPFQPAPGMPSSSRKTRCRAIPVKETTSRESPP